MESLNDVVLRVHPNLIPVRLTAPPIKCASSIQPTPTILTTTPIIVFAKDFRHDIDFAAFDAGTTFGTAGGEGGHSLSFFGFS